jgi:hypothetical protein
VTHQDPNIHPWLTLTQALAEEIAPHLSPDIFDVMRKTRASAIEAAAKVAAAHKGRAAKDRHAKDRRKPARPLEGIDEILAEERGEDIAAEIIASKIRTLSDLSISEGNYIDDFLAR